MTRQIRPKKMGLSSFGIFLPAALLLCVSTRHLIPFPGGITGQETILLWFVVAGLIPAGFFGGMIIKGLEHAAGGFDPSPPFMSFDPLTKGRDGLLLVWFPCWILNIMGEEILWTQFYRVRTLMRTGRTRRCGFSIRMFI